MIRLPTALVFGAVFLPTPSVAQAPTLVVENGRVIVGNGRVLEKASVVISGDRIVRITEAPVAAAGVRRLDARGMTVLPGLIDAHVHLTIRPTIVDSASLKTFLERDLSAVLNAFLQHGVTTVRSTADYWPWIGQIRDRITAGDIRGPRLTVAGPALTFQDAHPATTVCARNAFCRANVVAEVRSADHARATVQRLAREGVDFLKVVSDSVLVPIQIPDDVMASIIAQGHRHGLKVVAHIAEAEMIKAAARLGLDAFVHPTFRPLPAQDARALADVLVQHGTPVTTTLSAFLLYSGVPVGQAFQPGSSVRQSVERASRPLATMAEAGVQLVLGTDWCACFGPGPSHESIQAGAVTLTEMEMLGWGGLRPEAIIAAATINAARAIGLDALVGTVEVGKVADLLVVAGNPLEDIARLRNVRAVLKGGVIVVERQP